MFAGPEPDVFFGGERAAADPYENSVVALDARTGVDRWNFQTVHHDVWDYDLLAPPVLLDVTVDGERVPVLAQPGRAGYLYILDRRTGEPVFDIVETAVPASNVPGERLAATQPIPSKPPALARVSYTPEDLVTAADTNAEHAAFCRALRDRSGGLQNSGPFTPYRHRAPGDEPRSTIVFPGSLGGASWGGIAADPESLARLRQHEQRRRHRLARAKHRGCDVRADGRGRAHRASAVSPHERCRRAVGALLVE